MQKRVDPDQMPHSATSALGLHFLMAPPLRDAVHQWVNARIFISRHTDIPIPKTTYDITIIYWSHMTKAWHIKRLLTMKIILDVRYTNYSSVRK